MIRDAVATWGEGWSALSDGGQAPAAAVVEDAAVGGGAGGPALLPEEGLSDAADGELVSAVPPPVDGPSDVRGTEFVPEAPLPLRLSVL